MARGGAWCQGLLFWRGISVMIKRDVPNRWYDRTTDLAKGWSAKTKDLELGVGRQPFDSKIRPAARILRLKSPVLGMGHGLAGIPPGFQLDKLISLSLRPEPDYAHSDRAFFKRQFPALAPTGPKSVEIAAAIGRRSDRPSAI